MISYLCQKCCVKWDNVKSVNFTVTNGLRQGAGASPVYFNIYLDDLFIELKKSLGWDATQIIYFMVFLAMQMTALCLVQVGKDSNSC